MIELTDQAQKALKQFSEDEEIKHLNIRIKILGGGCSGLKFDMFYDDLPPTDLDETLKQGDITIICDPLSYSYIEGAGGAMVDYLETEFSRGYKFTLKNETIKSCGCGSSWSY